MCAVVKRGKWPCVFREVIFRTASDPSSPPLKFRETSEKEESFCWFSNGDVRAENDNVMLYKIQFVNLTASNSQSS